MSGSKVIAGRLYRTRIEHQPALKPAPDDDNRDTPTLMPIRAGRQGMIGA